ncbi:MAG TPA: serine/threonine-protein kinase [Trebonia sp.]|nr:serine/threonine-protein kinase [Trebonia sp.]
MDRVLAGRYELEVPLGRGGSGEVWRGRDMATRRPVAIKLVELSLIDDPGTLAETIGRFRREATVIGGLRHQNIVGALDAGRMANQLFMVMELAPGISLASMMDERGARGMGLFPVSSVLRITAQVCAGLAAAHEAGVVHRGIKPSNLMVTPQLGVKIIDFGIARLLADNSPRLTLPAQTVGTIAYISPEQAQGLDVDGRADLYSLGCVLYQLLSGRPPFFSTLPGALLMMQVMDRPTPLSVVRPDLPAGLSELVGDLLEKEPAARPATAAEVASRIAAIEHTLGPEEPEHEADRETIRAVDHRSTVADTRMDEAWPQSGRSTVLTPERMPGPPGPSVHGVPPWGFAAPPGPPGPPPASFPVPSQPGPPVRSAPQAATRRADPVPEWPVAQRGPRRSAWRAVVSTLIAAAIVAGVGAYLWERAHQTLKITSVKVTAAKQSVGCNGTADIIGTIFTNGHGGSIKYEWVRGVEANAPLVADDASGSNTVQVTLKWAFHGKGTGSAVAELRVLDPQQDEASIIFPYSCPR